MTDRVRLYIARAVEGLPVEKIAQLGERIKTLVDPEEVELLDPLAVGAEAGDYVSIVDSDLALLRTAHAVLMDMSIPDRNYIGCCCELVYAYMWNIPTSVYIGYSAYGERKWLRYHSNYIERDWEGAVANAVRAGRMMKTESSAEQPYGNAVE